MVIFDGNQKVRRPVCAADKDGHIEMYGHIQVTGCQDSPGYNSAYCSKHDRLGIDKNKSDSPPTKKRRIQTRAQFASKIKDLEKELGEGM